MRTWAGLDYDDTGHRSHSHDYDDPLPNHNHNHDTRTPHNDDHAFTYQRPFNLQHYRQ